MEKLKKMMQKNNEKKQWKKKMKKIIEKNQWKKSRFFLIFSQKNQKSL